jgi:hypothetical protein
MRGCRLPRRLLANSFGVVSGTIGRRRVVAGSPRRVRPVADVPAMPKLSRHAVASVKEVAKAGRLRFSLLVATEPAFACPPWRELVE